MTPKEAYCYLNCANLPPCSAAAGDCTACCKDCPKDYSNFSDTAYFDGSNFYKDFISELSYSESEDWDDNSTYQFRSTNVTSAYQSKDNKCLVYGSSRMYNAYEDGDVVAAHSFYSGNTAYGCGCDTNDCCLINTTCSSLDNCDAGPCCGSFTPSCGTCADDTCGSFNHGCIGLGCVCNDDECYGSYSEVNSAKIYFETAVKLYNAKGEIVDPTFIGASYDPCNPCATWDAGCHFFAS